MHTHAYNISYSRSINSRIYLNKKQEKKYWIKKIQNCRGKKTSTKMCKYVCTDYYILDWMCCIFEEKKVYWKSTYKSFAMWKRVCVHVFMQNWVVNPKLNGIKNFFFGEFKSLTLCTTHEAKQKERNKERNKSKNTTKKHAKHQHFIWHMHCMAESELH